MTSITAPVLFAAFALTLPLGATAQQPNACGSLENAVGPFDYRKPHPSEKQLVEGAHFTPPVEGLLRGATARLPAGDIAYTLRAFPNHHRALIATIRLAQREKTDKPAQMPYSVDCWLDRATRFQPDDAVVRMIFASWLGPRGRRDEAMAQLSQAERVAGDSAFTHYNLGLSYLELGAFDKALAKAHLARALGMTRTDLADRLRASGQWHEPSAAVPAASAASGPTRP
jgi:tetratricopeptide (TPR) repeat protein